MKIKASEIVKYLVQDEYGSYNPEKDTILQIFIESQGCDYWINVENIIVDDPSIIEVNNAGYDDFNFSNDEEIEIRILKDTSSEHKHFHIACRTWLDKKNGNTYHSVRIFHKGKEICHIPYEYGYSDQCISTAVLWLKENNYVSRELTKYEAIEQTESSYEIIPVSKKGDL